MTKESHLNAFMASMTAMATEVGEIARVFEDDLNTADADPLAQLAITLYEMKGLYTELDAALKLVYAQVERLNKGILPKRVSDAGMDMLRVPAIGRSFSVQTKYSASLIDKEAGFKWLRETGNASIIQETVNAGTLASFCRAMILDQGLEPPADIVKVSTYDTIGITKYTPKPGRDSE